MEGHGVVTGLPWPGNPSFPGAGPGAPGADARPADLPGPRAATPAGPAATGFPARRQEASGLQADDFLDRLRRGEPAALHCLAQEWAPRLYQRAVDLGVDGDLARDLTQEALVRALRSLRAGHAPQRLGPWLYTILINLVRDEARSAYRQRVELASATPDGPAPWSGAPAGTPWGAAGGLGADPAEVVARRDEAAHWARRLQAAFLALPLPLREVVVLRILDERPVAEVASVLGVAEGTVKSRLHRALKALRQALAASGASGEEVGHLDTGR